MTYYSMTDYSLTGFKKSKVKHKMYAAVLYNKQTKREILVNFGSSIHENYRDITGLNLYPELIHGDKKRRASYHKRHQKDVREGYYSPGYFSLKYLW